MPDTLALIHQSDTLLVLDKPAGLLCVPGRGADKQDCLSARVQARWPDARVVHRLDMATSGLVLMARGAAMQRALSQAFALRQIDKRYEAIVHGVLDDDRQWHEIDAPIAPDWPRRPLRIVDAAGQPSRTRWRVLRPLPEHGATHVLLVPVTGRTHQLRVHLAHIGHPIVGDALYEGDADRVENIASSMANTQGIHHIHRVHGTHDIAVQPYSHAPRLLLHASELALAHPLNGGALRFVSPVPFIPAGVQTPQNR
ncbi:MAG: RluA family pseudouridine synthase [Burkholderiaceae bacterium]|nr:RluA family pseudouridine synthase [Burkholderiaceae bacterium]